MKFIIQPINDTDCRIVDVDCSGLQGQALEEVTVPASVEQDGKSWQVKEVGPRVLFTNNSDDNTAKFASLRRLKKVIFSEGIEGINSTCAHSETLIDVVLPSTLKRIAARSFENCKALATINIPDGVEEIGDQAFRGCSSFPIFTWPKSLKKIGHEVFEGMVFPTETNEDGREVNSPIDLTLYDNIEEIKGQPYGNYANHNSLIINCHVCSPKAFEVLNGANKYEVRGWNGMEPIDSITEQIISIDIPEGVKKITAPFRKVNHLTLPSTLEEIGADVFRKSSALDCLSELPASLKVIRANAFSESCHSDEVKEIRINSKDIQVETDAFANEGKVKLAADEAVMKSLMGQPGAFNGTAIEAIDVPAGTPVVEVRNCPKLTRLTLPEGVVEVCVEHCPELAELVLPATVTYVKSISKCPKLENLVIPDSVIKIGKINENPSLKMLRLSANLEQLVSICDCPALTELSLPDSLQKFKEEDDRWDSIFKGLHADIKASAKVWKLLCSYPNGLRYYAPTNPVVLPEGVETIAVRAFNESELSAVILPESLKEIGEAAFQNCSNLKSVVIPAGIKILNEGLFKDCNSLESMEISEGSQLKKIETEAFSKTALKQIKLPDGFTALGGEVFKDIETLESVTFPASMTDFGFSINQWDETTTPFVRCKNLKQFIFLADDPASAVYPIALGKMADWYVADNMVEHVKAFIEKAKAENPKVKGIGAKSVKPLSKLKGGAPQPKKATPAKKKQELTQAIKMEAFGIYAIYRFAVDEADVPMLSNDIDMAILAVRYLREKAPECSFKVVDDRQRGSSWTVEELSLETAVNSATEKEWHSTPKSIVNLNFADTGSLPEGFPVAIAPEVAKQGGFQKLFASRCSNYDKELPSGAPAYLEVKISFRVAFDFMIGEKEKFNVKKITVMEDWDWDSWRTKKVWRYAFLYNGRYIPATSIIPGDEDGFYLYLKASKDLEGEDTIAMTDTFVDGVRFTFQKYKAESLPFFNDILSLMK